MGRWIGVGTGQYPTIEDFRFGQEVQFSCDGRPFLTYWSRSWLLDDDGNQIRPTATETGFVRCTPDRSVELLLTHPTGFAELWEGSVEITNVSGDTITGARMELRTDLVARTEGAKPYTAGHRLYGLVNGELLWTFDMAAMGLPLQNHIAGRLRPAAALRGEDAESQPAANTEPPAAAQAAASPERAPSAEAAVGSAEADPGAAATTGGEPA